MNLDTALHWTANLPQKLAALAGAFLLSAFAPNLSAQTPSFAYADAQILPGSLTNSFSYVATAVDRAGNVYMTDANLHTVQELPAGSSQLAPVKASGVTNPAAIAVDAAGNLYIANNSGTAQGASTSSIIKLTPAGVQSTVASGWVSPVAVSTDAAGDVFVLDWVDQPAYAAQLFEVPANTNFRVQLNMYGLSAPYGMAADPAGDVFIADRGLGAIVELPHGGSAPETLRSGYGLLQAIATDLAGNVFFLNGGTIGEIPAGNGQPLTVYQGPGYSPVGSISVDANGSLIFPAGTGDVIAEVQRVSVNFGSLNICVPGLTATGSCAATQTLWLNTTGATPGIRFLTGGVPSTEFTATAACSSTLCPAAVTFSPKFAGPRNAIMQVLDASGTVQSSTLVYGFGIGPQATYSPVQSTLGLVAWPADIAVDGGGNVFATAQGVTHVLEYPAAGGAATTLGAGIAGPFGVAVDALGNIFASDYINNRVVTIAPNGAQRVLSSNVNSPYGVAVDNVGNVYVADHGDNRVVKISAIGGVQTTINGGAWQNPLGVAVDGAGNIYTTDGAPTPARQVRKFNLSTGVSTTLGTGFTSPCGLAVDAAGDVYVADTSIAGITEIPANGSPQIVIGTGIVNPCGVAVDAGGNVYISDGANGRIVKLTGNQVPSLSFASTNVNQTSSDSPKAVQLANVGNMPLLAAGGLSSTTNFAQVKSTGSLADCGTLITLQPGATCDMSFGFKPTSNGLQTSADVLALNAYPASATIPLSGTGVDVPASISVLSGSGQSAIFSSAFAQPLTVVVKDASGVGVANIPVSFTSNGLSIKTATVVTNASGIASVTATAGGTGTLTATASISGVATHAVFTETGIQATVTVTPLSFSWAVGQPFTLSKFTLTGLLNNDGYTGAPALTTTAVAGSPAGAYTIRASLGTLSLKSTYKVVFNTGTLTLDNPAHIAAVLGNSQSTTVGHTYLGQLVAEVFGTGNELLGGVPVNFTSTQMNLSAATVTTSAFASGSVIVGSAAVTATPYVVGNLTVMASIPGTSLSATFTEKATAATPAKIYVSSGNSQTTVYGSAFAQPFSVLVTDASGFPVSGVTVGFIGTNVRLSNGTAITNASGIASLTGVATAAGSLNVNASIKGLASTATFAETGTPAPLTVTANNATMTFNTYLPNLTYTITGFVNGDTAAVVGGTPFEMTYATQYSSPGTYPIIIGPNSLYSPNYTFNTYVNGTLTITLY